MLWTSVMVPEQNGLLSAQPSPYFGQPVPGNIPVLFAPSIIPNGAYSISFTPDGLECMMTLMINNLLTSFTLEQNYPNPRKYFNPVNRIHAIIEQHNEKQITVV